jgi:nucleoside-diphosphate-sugar epimerase
MIAVTGANGLLGSYIIRKLMETNTPCVAVKRPNSDTRLLDDLNGQINWRDADVLDIVSLHEALRDCTGVIHAAAMVSFSARYKNDMMHVNVNGTRHVVDACLSLGIKRLLHISSVSALGRTAANAVINETQTWEDSPLNSAYGESKYKAELEVFRGQEEGLRTVTVNPSVILARGHWDRSSAKIFNYVKRGGLFYTAGAFNYVDVRDVTEVIFQLYHSQHEGERYIVNAGLIGYKEFFHRAADFMGVKPPRIEAGGSLLRTVAFAENIRSLITGKEPVITREMARIAETQIRFDNKKIQALPFSFRTLDETLLWCAEFYRKQSELKN